MSARRRLGTLGKSIEGQLEVVVSEVVQRARCNDDSP